MKPALLRALKWSPLALLGVAAAVWFALRSRGPEVLALRPTRREVVQTVVASGRVRAAAEVNVGATLAGVVRTVGPREGARVREGEVLVTFVDDALVAQVAQARAGVSLAQAHAGQLRQVGSPVAGEAVRQAQAAAQAAAQTWSRQRALFATGAVAAAELEAARRARDIADSQLAAARLTAAGARPGGSDGRVAGATLAQAQAALLVAEARLAEATVRAPAPGVVLRRAVEPGDIASPGRVLLTLLRDGPTELQITPDERNLALLRLGQSALASSEAFPTERFGATVSYLAPAVDAQRGTVEVRLAVPSPPAYLRTSMTVSVEVEVRRRANVLTLPPDAVRDAATPRPWVMVVEGDVARRRDVQLGAVGGDRVEVTAGVREDDVVVPSAGAPSTRVGRRVRAVWGR
jgi:HlyD family secretion protein